MEALQHYYTSYVNKENGSGGFQTKGISPSLTSDAQTTIIRLISYRVPPSLEEKPLAVHPKALRYYYKDAKEAILLCSQSSGKDEYGRSGNFFAHSLIVEPELFKQVPPIFFWNSNFWCARDKDAPDRFNNHLPTLSLENREALDADGIWDFLKSAKRRELLGKLLCAVVHSHKTHRRIVILDTIENVVWWIAAVSMLLPTEYRPLLTFATYHHDPSQAQFMIIGTTSDSAFRASAEEHLSYFILDAQNGTTSNVASSPYAELVAHSLTPDLYETQLLPVFTDCTRRFPLPNCIDEQLDQVVIYANVLRRGNTSSLTSEEIEAIHTALTGFEELQDYHKEDRDELHKLADILLTVYGACYDAAVYAEYERAKKLDDAHDLVMRELMTDTKRLLKQQSGEQAAHQHLEKLRGEYKEIFEKTINDREYLKQILSLLQKANEQQLASFWSDIGKYLIPGDRCKDLLHISLRIVGTTMNQLRNEEGDMLMSIMWDVMRGREQEWLHVASQESSIKLPDDAIEHFYYCFVYPLNLEQRIPYRMIVQHACHDLLTYELQSDVRSAIEEHSSNTHAHIAVIENWIRHARNHNYDPLHVAKLIKSGLIQLKKDYPPMQWNSLAPSMLRSSVLTPLPSDMEQQWMNVILSTVSLNQFSTEYLDLYKKCQDHRSLSAIDKLVIRAISAVTSGVIDHDLSNAINKYVTALRPDMYREVVARCVPEFLQSVVTAENHNRFVSAFMVWTQGWKHGQLNYFWQTYQNVLISLFLQSATTQQSIRLMSFWFAQPPNSYVSLYVPQYFFMILPTLFEQARKSANFNESLRYFQMEASRCYWYPSIQHLLVERKGLLGRIKFGRIKDFILQNEDRVAAEKVEVPSETKRQVQEGHAEVMQLFSHKDVVQAHRKYLKKIYPPSNMAQNREQFWSKYWELFIATIADDVRDALALLSFWFDDSFEVLGNVPYVSQEFFIGLVEALESTRKYGKFRDVAIQMKDEIYQNRNAYRWYTFIVGYLPDVK